MVTLSAGVEVVALDVDGRELAAIGGVTGIGSAHVLVVTGEVTRRNTTPQMTVVAGGTDILIVAGSSVELVRAPCIGVAGIGGARVGIIAIEE